MSGAQTANLQIPHGRCGVRAQNILRPEGLSDTSTDKKDVNIVTTSRDTVGQAIQHDILYEANIFIAYPQTMHSFYSFKPAISGCWPLGGDLIRVRKCEQFQKLINCL